MNSNIFREYDIRGIVGKELTDKVVRIIADSIGTFFSRNNAKTIAVGFDARESSTRFRDLLIKGLNRTGCDVVLIGRVPTPVLYHTVYTKDVAGGVMITGSHNPVNHNGFKICLGEQTLFGPQIQEIKNIAFSNSFAEGTGSVRKLDVLDGYQRDVLKRIEPSNRRLKVVVDAGNGMGGVTAVPVYRNLGVDVVELFTEPDSTFPNHPPDPAATENLTDAINAIRESDADLAIAFDGDGDRITVIDENGEIVWGDELTTLFAHEVLKENPGATVIGEVKCSQNLFDEVEKLGGTAVMSKAGHSIIKAKMTETNALLAGEMSGHIFFADRYYGFDDACYSGARILELMSKTGNSMSELLSGLPEKYSTPEIRIPCAEEFKHSVIDKIADRFTATNEVLKIDGARIIFENGWGLVRASNTQAILVLRFEADDPERLAEIQNAVETELNGLLF
jgi:phosphomannomutase/phosphoglucomutase